MSVALPIRAMRLPVRVRHIVRASTPGAPVPGSPGVGTAVTVLGESLIPDEGGPGGSLGWSAGQVELRMMEEGRFALRFPNTEGSDGRLHRERFACLTVDDYRAGDEWIEIYAGEDLLFVGTPTEWRVASDVVEVGGYDPFWTLNQVRETTAGFWAHFPRDVWEHYTRVWKYLYADDFSNETITWINDGTIRTTGDGRLDYKRAGTATLPANPGDPPPGRIRLVNNTDGTGASLEVHPGLADIDVSDDGTDPSTYWRLEVVFYKSGKWPSTVSFRVALENSFNASACEGILKGSATQARLQFFSTGLVGATYNKVTKADRNDRGPHSIAMEGRGRWLYCYFDGQLCDVLPIPSAITGPENVTCFFGNSSPTVGHYVDVSSISLRRTRPHLMQGADKGDRYLGLALSDLPTGGLRADYYDDNDLAYLASNDQPAIVLNPTRVPYRQKIEDNIDFGNTAWEPGTLATENWSCRFHGCIWLDLAARDISIAIQAVTNSRRFRLWFASSYWSATGADVDQWYTAGGAGVRFGVINLRSLFGAVSGWYPIIVETMVQSVSGTSGLKLEYTTDAGQSVWATVPKELLSPLGCVVGQIRGESHYEALRSLAGTWGYQFRTEPMALGSGAFPGQLAPHLRVGRDTEKVVEGIETAAYEMRGSAVDTADVIFADGGGLVDAREGSQPTTEAIDYSKVESRLYIRSAYESLSELTDKQLLARRIDSLLTLRRNVFEEPSARPVGATELLDAFPLSGSLASFMWQPGDGVRLHLPDIGIEDVQPRQIFGVARDIVPDGIISPTVSFKPRPRNFLRLLKEIRTQALRGNRARRPSARTIVGSIGAQNSSAILDNNSRAPAPDADEQIVAAWFVLHTQPTSTWQIHVNGVGTGLQPTQPGRYDITGFVETEASAKRIRVGTLLVSGAGTEVIHYQLEMDVVR